jgi:hypothetical protein
MFYDWTFSTPSASADARAQRYTADLKVTVTLPFESWQLMWTLRSLNISNTGILCALDVINEASAQRATDLITLLDAQPEVQIQIETPSDDIFAPILNATVVRKLKRPWGLEVALNFNEESDDLLSLISSLDGWSTQQSKRQN